MNIEELLPGLARSPDYFLHDLDFVNQRGLVVRLDEAVYRRASFLDQRALKADTRGAWFPMEAVYKHTQGLKPAAPAHFIFHVSHCGSTLVSRLLAELAGCEPLREPLALLGLALQRRELDRPVSRLDGSVWDRLFALVFALLSRTYRPGERTLVKATSACANLLAPLAVQSPSSRALMLYDALESWLPNMLRDEQVRENGRFYAQAWLMDFHVLTGRKDLRLAELKDAEQFAVNWLTGMLHFERARQQTPERTRLCDFEAFLADPARELQSLGQFLGYDTGHAAQAAAGPLMKSYAKNTDRPFDAGQRRRELEESRRQNAEEFHAGMKFAEKLCGEIAMLAPLGAYLTRS
ncbi:MAG: hypothetical protein ACM3ZT_11290 [Bacillota bacterium]